MNAMVDRFGRVVIPKKLRDLLGLHAGTHVTIQEADGKLEISVDEGSSAMERGANGRLILTGKLIGPMEDFLAADRHDRSQHLLGSEE